MTAQLTTVVFLAKGFSDRHRRTFGYILIEMRCIKFRLYGVTREVEIACRSQHQMFAEFRIGGGLLPSSCDFWSFQSVSGHLIVEGRYQARDRSCVSSSDRQVHVKMHTGSTATATATAHRAYSS